MVAAQVLLAAADKQLVTLTRATAAGLAGGEVGTAVPGGPDTAVLRVKLPLVAAPASRADWAWHVIVFTVPPHVPAHADLVCAHVAGGRASAAGGSAVHDPGPGRCRRWGIGWGWGWIGG